MTWSDLHPNARVAILAAGFLLLILLLWSFVVAPLRAAEADTRTRITSAEAQLEQMERRIEAVPPASAEEQRAWQSSSDALLGQLGPESEMPLFIEALVRLAEAQGVDAFLTADGASASEPSGNATEQVLGAVPGTRRIELSVQAYGDHAGISRFLSQIGRLGWVTEIAGADLARSFPEVSARIVVRVYFRADSAIAASGGAR